MERIHLDSALDTFCKVIESPVGQISLVACDIGLVSLMWGSREFRAARSGSGNKIAKAIVCDTEFQLKEYFLKKRVEFDLPLAPKGSDFQLQVWSELKKIPYGKTISYGEQAKRLKRPQAARAVGAANGKNPIGIIVPCHRVVGANGSLTGFAGGLNVKRFLLGLESAQQSL